MIINLELDTAAQAASAAVKAIWQQAANIIGSMFTDNITVNLSVDFSGTGGGAAAGPAGGLVESYSTIYTDLKNGASPGDSSFDFLPAPGSGSAPSTIDVWDAQLKALGLLSPTGSEVDGNVFFNTDISQSLLLGVALHEFTHALARVPDNSPDIMQLDRFTSAGNRLYTGAIPAPASYFSINGGASVWAAYGIGSDPSDFLNSQNYSGDGTSPLSVEDSFNEFYDNNTLQHLTPLDLENMDILGFHLKYDAPASDGYDFNGGNSGDILLQNSSGQIEYANMAGGTFQGFVNVASVSGYTIVGEGKISGGVDSNIVIENSSGQILYANMANGSFSKWVMVSDAPGYNVVGVGDINDDHYADIVIQNPINGSIVYANMDNGVFNGWVNVAGTPGCSVVAVADINNDGYDDIVLQNNSSGAIVYANMHNGVFGGWVGITGTPGWNVVGAGDIARDGYADIVIQNPTTGAIDYANMNNGVFNGWIGIGTVSGWHVIGVEDVLGNGFDDIVIQNSTTGQIDYANMTAGVFNGWNAITSAPGYTGYTQPDIGAGGSPPGGGSTQNNGDGPPGTVLGPVVDTHPAPGLGSPSGGSSALSGLFAQDPAAPNGGSPSGGSNVLSANFAQDPTAPNGGSPSVDNNVLSGVFAKDPAAPNSGSPSGDSNMFADIFMQDPASLNGIGGAADFINGQSGSPDATLPTSASWLTEGAQNGSTPTNGVAQMPSNPAPIVTADNLQNLLHSS